MIHSQKSCLDRCIACVFHTKSKFGGLQEYTEVAQKMNGFRMPKVEHQVNASTYMSLNVALQLPTEVDWRTQGYVTPVKDQVCSFEINCLCADVTEFIIASGEHHE